MIVNFIQTIMDDYGDLSDVTVPIFKFDMNCNDQEYADQLNTYSMKLFEYCNTKRMKVAGFRKALEVECNMVGNPKAEIVFKTAVEIAREQSGNRSGVGEVGDPLKVTYFYKKLASIVA